MSWKRKLPPTGNSQSGKNKLSMVIVAQKIQICQMGGFIMTVEELRALLSDVGDDGAEVVIKNNKGVEMCSSCILAARYEREFYQLVRDENEKTKAEYVERVVLVI